jgi:hypothetical protein
VRFSSSVSLVLGSVVGMLSGLSLTTPAASATSDVSSPTLDASSEARSRPRDGGSDGGDAGLPPDGGDGASAPLVRPRAAVFDDGLRVPGDPSVALPESPFPGDSVELFALRGETVAFQVVLEPDGVLHPLHAAVGTFVGLRPRVTVLAEHFVDLVRTSGNDRDDSSLAWTPSSRPKPALLGPYADALVPEHDVELLAARRAAFWIDVEIPLDAAPGLYESRVFVSSKGGVLVDRAVRVRVAPQAMPYAAMPMMVFYEPKNLVSRMGAKTAEPQLRALLHAHHLAAFDTVLGPEDLEREVPYLTGEAFTRARGYEGPGEGRGEGIAVFGAYGDLDAPKAEKIAKLVAMQRRVESLGASTETFLYAVDEDCKSPWPAAWRRLLDASSEPEAKRIRVGATCGEEPASHPADVVMIAAQDFDTKTRDSAVAKGKAVWAYNGKRPYAGPMVTDAPAVDLRANAWIAARYGIPRWFFWEATSWTPAGGGKVGGPTDPFVTADTFHNKDGDHSNGDGILLYPGTQIADMTSFGDDVVYPSVRLKNLRRGIQDAGYIGLARSRPETRAEAEAVVGRMIPSALREMQETSRTPWSDDARPWLDARRELFALVLRAPKDAVPAISPTSSPPLSRPSADTPRSPPRGPLWGAVVVLTLGIGLAGERVARSKRVAGAGPGRGA